MLHYTSSGSSPRDKKLLFESGLALLCLPVVFLEFMLLPQWIFQHEADIKLLANLGFLGLNHIGCTPSYILGTAENREWFYKQFTFKTQLRDNAFFKMLLLIFSTALFSYWAQRSGNLTAKNLLAAYIGVWTTFHGLKQHYGLHKLIPQKWPGKIGTLRFLYGLLTLVSILNVILLNIFAFQANHWVRWVTCVIAWLTVLAICKIEVERQNKVGIIYSLRLVTWPLNASFIAAMTERAVHGFTYWNFIKYKMQGNFSPVPHWVSMLFFVLLASVLYALGDSLTSQSLGLYLDSKVLLAFESLFLGAVIGHASLDRYLFSRR